MNSPNPASLGPNAVIIGLGYVGLPLARSAVRGGWSVTGFDKSQAVVQGISAGWSHIDDVSDDDIKEMLEEGFAATDNPAAIDAADVILLCVPTPLDVDGRPDLAAVYDSVNLVSARMKPGTLVILESTTSPGTTEETVLPLLERGSRVVGEDFFLAFSPERVDPGNTQYEIENTPKIVGGATESCSNLAQAFYSPFVDQIVVARGTKEAEAAKLLENTYRHINIALVNEMARVCHELNVDIWDVIRCASTKPFGFQAFRPGVGVGGHCIPIDPNYFSYAVKAKLGYPLRFVELAQEINSTMPQYVARRVQDMLNRDGIPLNGARILLVGVTYKRDISDQRESPAGPLATSLRGLGAELYYYDPYVPKWSLGGFSVPRVVGPDEGFEAYDVVVVIQPHSCIDFKVLQENSRRVFDTSGSLTSPSTERL